MLSVREFTAGALANATPLSLILPRTKYEATILVGRVEGQPTALFLSGQHAFRSFESANNQAWKGMIVPNVDVEVDETSSFDPDREDEVAGVLIRADARLLALGVSNPSFGRSVEVTVYDDLPLTHNARVAFWKWQVVIGEGDAKRVLARVNVGRPT